MARDFLDSKRNANGILSEEDSKTYDAMEQTIVDLGKEIQRLEKQAEIEAEMKKPTSNPLLNTPNTPDGTAKKGTTSAEYSEAFWNRTASETATFMMFAMIYRLELMQRAVILFLMNLKRNLLNLLKKKIFSVRLQQL